MILDDSIEEKPYTDENEIVAWHYSHAKNRCVKGINLLSCLVCYGDISLPINYEPNCKDVAFSEVKTKKERRVSSVTKNELFRSIIGQAVANQVLFEYVLTDNWFGANKNMEFIHHTVNERMEKKGWSF